MKFVPYLSFDGNTEEAFAFYEKALGGKTTALLRFGDSPGCENMPAADKNKIMHARFEVGDQVLLATDATGDHPYQGNKGMQLTIQVKEPAEAERVFAALADGAQHVVMPIGETFWSVRFGMLVDRYGTPWMVNCEQMPAGAEGC